MPTGYTAAIEEREDVTFKEFAMLCARNFGATIMMRDDPFDAPIPEEFEPESYYQEKIKEIEAELKKVFTEEEVKRLAKEEYANLVAHNKELRERESRNLKRYKRMLKMVNAWRPPTTDHIGLRNFMIQQIEISMPKGDIEDYLEKPKKLSVTEWLEKRHIKLRKDLEYYLKEDVAERERTAGRNKWLKELRKSLE